jgi:bifunctional DNA-binding transcriptional regulator/antitoxin component of YhaV-PrlF toxin-antitoxin module
MPAEAVYELNDFIAAYRRTPRGFEDWQIALRIASVVASAIKRCEMDEVVEYISAALDASGIDRYAVYSTYIHGLSPNVVEALYHIFPNIAPRIGADAPMITQLPAAETPTVAADTAHLPTPPAEAKDAPRGGLKEPPVAGPGEVVLHVSGLAEYGTHLGTVRLPLSAMERLGLKPGDFVEIIGATSTYAVVQPTEEEDVVKMDEVTRSNAGAELGDYVRIKKAVLPPAEKIVLKTNQPVDAEYVKRYLLFKPLARGNITAVPQQDKTVTLRVEDVVPAPAAYVQLSTKIEIQHDSATYSEHRQPEVGTSPAPYVLLKVAEARSRDSGRSIVRIPVRIMKKLGVDPADYVEIVGRKTAYANVWPAYPEDEDKDIVRMDGIIRQNAGVGIGDTVKVKKVYLKPAQRVVLAPTEPIRLDPEYLKEQILLHRPVARGQAIDVPFYGGVIRFVVVQVQPGPAAYVTIDTDVIIRGVERTTFPAGYSKPSAISLPSRELSAGKELLLGTADLFRAFGFLTLFISFIYVATNYDAVGFNMPIFISTVGYIVSALISPIVSTFADRRAWASALIGILGIIPLFVIKWKVSSVDLADLFTFVILWLSITAIISIQAYLEEWGSGRFYAALAGVIGVGYMVLAIAKTIDAIRRYAKAV